MRKLVLLIASLLLSLPFFTGNSVESGHIDGESLLMLDMAPTASITDAGTLYEDSKLFVSQVYEAKSPFQLLGINWTESLPKGTEAGIEIRFRKVDGTWSDWQGITADADSPDGKTENTLWSYTVTDESNAFQYRALLSTDSPSITPKISKVSFDYVNGGETKTITKLQKLIFGKDESVVTREDWGADESLRLSKSYNIDSNDDFTSELDTTDVQDDPSMEIIKKVTKDESGNALLWPLEYPDEIKKIIIHHTASSNDSLDDPESVVRAIYYYHAVTRGWGDIGYNYIVGPDGTVYEGRAGGDGVVGGHASGFNTGSIGISLLGNYEEKPIPSEMVQGLMGLIYEKADLYDIDPTGDGEFRGEDLSNILGHKDVGSTACPGKYTYSVLEDIRSMVGLALDQNRHTNVKTTYAYEEVGDRELVAINPNGTATVKIKIKNTGTKTWDKNTFLTVNANYSADSIVSIPKDSKKRTAVINETSVAKGKVATFSFTVSAGMMGGLASFDMAPVFNGTEKTTNTMDLGFYVEPPVMEFETLSIDSPSALKPGASYNVTVKIKNQSGFDWEKSGDYPVKLKATSSSSLVSKTSLADMTESTVKNGETATFAFTIKAPTKAGTYSLYFAPEMENSSAVASSSAQLSVKVSETTEDAVVSSGSTDLTFTPGESKMLWLSVKNTGTKTWSTTGSSAFKLIFSKPTGLDAVFNKLSIQKVSPDISAKVYFTVTAPKEAGTYTLKIFPRLGNTNLIKTAYSLAITVEAEENFTTTAYTNPIRVKLTPSNGVGTPVISSNTSFGVYDDSDFLKTFTASSRVRVTTQDSGEFKITSGSTAWEVAGPVRFVPETDGIMQILTMYERPTWDTSLNDNQFRGTIEVANVDDETVLINELPIEDYLKGIGEVSNGDAIEKVKTIIVLARTYATYYTTGVAEKFPGKPYNLDDDPNSSQKYLGYGFESRSSNVAEAVKDTEGLVVTYNGEVVITPYFSESNGVATKSAKEVWGWTDTPWLISVPDTYCDATAFYGHGVGLSGCGATTMAEMGETFEDIIKYYYTGVAIEKL